MVQPNEIESVQRLAGGFPALKLLVLHGSRARGDATSRSDWDFAYLGDADLDELELRSRLTGALRTDHLDLADLTHAGALLRYRVARDGVLLFERAPGLFETFCYEAASFWLEIEPIIRAEHRDILNALG